MFQLIEQTPIISTKNNLAVENSFFMLPKVKLLGHEIGYNTLNPYIPKLQLFTNFPLPLEKSH